MLAARQDDDDDDDIYIYIYIHISNPTKDSKTILNTSLLSTKRYVSRVKWSNPRKGVAPSLRPLCNSY